MEAGKFGLVFRPVVVDRVVYVTITVMSVLIIYDGWERLRLIDVAGIIVGPVFAMFLGHVFSASVARQVELERSLTGQERLQILRGGPLPAPVRASSRARRRLGSRRCSLTDGIFVIVWARVASLGLWGGVAGRRAGFTGWHLAPAVLAGLLVGIVVLALYVLLQPGKARPGGIALG